MSKSLFDVDGNYVGEGGQGFMTQPGVDPTGGGHAKVVTEGVKTMEEETQPQPVANVKPNLVGWNGWKPVESSNGGQSVDGSTASAEKKVTIPRREDRPAAYPTKARRDADAAASVGQELTDEQKAAVQNAGATPSPLSPAEQEAEKKDIEAGKSNTLNVVQLQGEKELNPESSNTGADNGGQSPTASNGGQDNGGQSVVPAATEVKTETSVNTAPSEVSEEDYNAALKRIKDDVAKGGIGTEEDKLIVFDYEHPHKVMPKLPKLDAFVPSAPPKLKSIDSSYRAAYSIMQERMKAAGDDPASKAKRAKARRAEKLVAALGDLLQVAANMWGVARGANSAKLSSISAGVSKRHATEDALALKREAQYAKDLERAVTRDQALTKEQNEYNRALWKAAEDARKHNISEKNKALLAQYNTELQGWKNDEAQRGRDRHQVQVQHDRQVNYLNNHRYRSSEIGQRTAGSIAAAQERGMQSRLTKQTPSASKTSSSSSSSSSGYGNTIKKKEGES
jgi:hypothetical protein